MTLTAAKERVCKAPGCHKRFTPTFNSTQAVCSPQCALALIRHKAIKKEAREKKVQYTQRQRSHWLDEAQKAVNAFIRVRDLGKPCVSCDITYGQFHAGHFRSVGAAAHLRYNTFNIHAQCSQCNNHKSGNQVEYRRRLIDRIGGFRLERLETDNRLRSYNIAYLKRITALFKRRAKHYRKLRGL